MYRYMIHVIYIFQDAITLAEGIMLVNVYKQMIYALIAIAVKVLALLVFIANILIALYAHSWIVQRAYPKLAIVIR